MTKSEAFEEINKIQDEYVDELVSLINSQDHEMLKTINFTSPTGTGKTKMMSKLINRFPDYYFIITTLSKGQLHIQIRENLNKDCVYNNYIVYGTADYRINSKLEAEDIIGMIPDKTKCIWLRDEGHIRTNRFDEILLDECYKVVNFSATNEYNDIQCNFAQTMMLRTVNQNSGGPESAIFKLIEIKNTHKDIKDYNPCAIFRCISGRDSELYKCIIKLCKKYKLKYIDITDEDYIMSELCEDNNKYDVIINKMKIVEGIDIRRAHVLFMDNQPSNNATAIQAIGRCRRNALLYRDDIDILAPENIELLKSTRECFVYFNNTEMKVEVDLNGELQNAFCNHISCESLKVGIPIDVVDGQLSNGLYVIELNGRTGRFNIESDEATGFNIVNPINSFYDTQITHIEDDYLYVDDGRIKISNVKKLPLLTWVSMYDDSGHTFEYKCEPYYRLSDYIVQKDAQCIYSEDVKKLFENIKLKFNRDYFISKLQHRCIDNLILKNESSSIDKYSSIVENYILANSDIFGLKQFCTFLSNLSEQLVQYKIYAYTLNEVCSKEEIDIIGYHCIQMKNDGSSNVDIERYIQRFVTLRCEYINIMNCMHNNNLIKIVFDNLEFIGECDESVLRFVSTYYERENGNCSDVLNNLNTNEWDDDNDNENIYAKIHKLCSYIELKWIQFCCIKEIHAGIDDNAINELLNEYVAMRYETYLLNNNQGLVNITAIILNDSPIKVLSTYDSVGEYIDFRMSASAQYDCKISATEDDVYKFFYKIDTMLDKWGTSKILFYDENTIVDSFIALIDKTAQDIKDGTINSAYIHCERLFENVKGNDQYLLRNGYKKSRKIISINKLENHQTYLPYDKILNDKESAIIGVDLMKQIKTAEKEIVWTESKTVSAKVGNYNKLNSFITKKYKNELSVAKEQCFAGKNNFALDTKLNSMIGYCVEYYSKYLLYGEQYLEDYYDKAMYEAKSQTMSDNIVIRACMLKYREMMMRSFGSGISRFIKTIPADKLDDKKYNYFISLIVELGTKTARYVGHTLYNDEKPINNVDPDLTINHISGLSDYVTADTILDVKVRNNIDEKCIRQVLAYHYLSTKRSDLCIRRVIVYDAVSDKAVTVDITPQNVCEWDYASEL